MRASAATGEAVERAADAMAGSMAAGGERLGKALVAFEESTILRRTAAAAQGALASVASAAESALDSAAAAAAAAKDKARRAVAARAAARAAASAEESVLEAEAHARPVPSIVAACVHWLAAAGCDTEGLFATDGNPESVDKLAALFDRTPAALVPLRAAPADVAALLKRYLLALPAPLLSHAALARAGVPVSHRAAEALDNAAPAAAATAELLLSLAARISSLSAVSKMDAAKLARALAPCLTRRVAPAEAAPAAPPSPPQAAAEEADAASVTAMPSSPPAAAQADADAEDEAAVATLKWMIANWGTLRGADAPAPLGDEQSELSE